MTQEPCVTGTQATVEAAPGDVLTVTAHNALGDSPPSVPIILPDAATAPTGYRVRVTVEVEVQ